MLSILKKSSVAATMAFLFVLVFSCGEDKLILGPRPGPMAIYDAHFYFTRDYGTDTAKTVKAKLNWNFLSDKAFNYSVDNEDPFTDPDNGICSVSSGEYSRITINDITFSNAVAGDGTCDAATLINGTFSFKTVADTIEIEQDIPEQEVHFLIRLVRAGLWDGTID